jgi:hypothetical protein
MPAMHSYPIPKTQLPHVSQHPSTIPAQTWKLFGHTFTLPAQKQTLPPAEKQFLPVPVLPQPHQSNPQLVAAQARISRRAPPPNTRISITNPGGVRNVRTGWNGGGPHHGGGHHGRWHGGGYNWWWPYYNWWPYYGYGYGYGYNYPWGWQQQQRIVCERIPGDMECPDGTIVRTNADGSKTCCPPQNWNW